MLTKQQVLDSVKGYFTSIVRREGSPGCGWKMCALSSLLPNGQTEYYAKSEIEQVLGVGPYEFWPKGSFYKLITDFNDEWIGRVLPISEVNFFLAGLAAKENLNFTPIRVPKPFRLETAYDAAWERV